MSIEWIQIGPCKIACGDCLDILGTLPPVDAVVTDPPYGCEKAEWDGSFFGDWYPLAKSLGCPIYTITGSQGTAESLRMVNGDFVAANVVGKI